MNKLNLIAAIVAATIMTGCQTRITATKNAEVANPVQKVVQVNGQDVLITDHYQVTSGGWEATARSPLWATETLKGLVLGVETNGTVRMELDAYGRDLSTNAVAMTREMFSGGAQLAIAIGDAYCKIAGGGAQADTVTKVVAKAYNLFKGSGGDETKATVTTDPATGTLKVSDGTTCVTCDKSGNCTAGNCSTGTCTTGNCSDTPSASN